MSLRLPYTVLDVFAERPLEGNPLLVFHDGRGLSTGQMQALARETNLSETTFVLPADDPEEDLREGVTVRIFTTEEELPFAGHPTLGTASWLRLHHPALRGAGTVTLRLKAGRIPVQFTEDGTPADDPAWAPQWGRMRQNDPTFGESFDPAEVAGVLGVEARDLLAGYQPQIVSTGNAFCIVPFASVEALGRLQIPQAKAAPWLRKRNGRWFYCIAAEGDGRWRARMQWNGGEDPATGSAAGPCAAWLVQQGLQPSGRDAELQQGVEVQRASRLVVQATLGAAGVTGVQVAGRTIPVAAGEFRPR